MTTLQKYTDTTNRNSIMPHLERGPSEYSFSTPKNESAMPSSIDMMPPDASLPDIKLTSTRMLQNREQQKGIQFSHTSGPQKYDDEMMVTEYIDNEAKIDIALSISIMETNNKSSATDCMKNFKHSMSNAKDCKQNVTVKKHK